MKRLLIVLVLLLATCVGAQAKGPVCPDPGVDLRAAPVHTTKAKGATLAYRVLGQGEPLLMIMGYAGTMDVWDHQLVGLLSQQYSVILMDNRGMGHSTTTKDQFGIRDMAADALAVLDAMHIAKTHVMGWSMGSTIAQELALAHPERVGKLILYGTLCDSSKIIPTLDEMAKLAPEQFVDMLFPAAWARGRKDVYACLPRSEKPADPEVIGRQYQAIKAWAPTCSKLSQIKASTLVVSGEDDNVTPVELGLEVASLVPGAWVARFGGGGHWVMYQSPQGFAHAVLNFLQVHDNLLRPKPMGIK